MLTTRLPAARRVVSLTVLGVFGVVGIGLPAAAGAATGSSGTYAVPSSIPSDCSRDVTTALMGEIATVPDNSVLSFAPGGCYQIDGTVQVKNRNGLTFEGNGATFRAMTSGRELGPKLERTRSIFTFFGGTNLTVRDTIAVGANPHGGANDHAYVPALEGQTAYVIGGVQNALLDHVQAYDTYGDFVFVGPRTQNLTVRNSTFARNGRQGWNIEGGHNIIFDHNQISATARATIDMEPSSNTNLTDGVTISDNWVGHGTLFFLANDGAPAVIRNVNIVNNTLVGKALTIHVHGPAGTRSNYTVAGNTSDVRQSQGGGGIMSFVNVVGLTIRNNTQPAQRARGISGVALLNSQNVTVVNNQFLNAIAPIDLRDTTSTYRQARNYVGNPLTLFPQNATLP